MSPALLLTEAVQEKLVPACEVVRGIPAVLPPGHTHPEKMGQQGDGAVHTWKVAGHGRLLPHAHNAWQDQALLMTGDSRVVLQCMNR